MCFCMIPDLIASMSWIAASVSSVSEDDHTSVAGAMSLYGIVSSIDTVCLIGNNHVPGIMSVLGAVFLNQRCVFDW